MRWLTTSICTLHLLFIALLFFGPRIPVKSQRHKPLVVRHVPMPVTAPTAQVKTTRAAAPVTAAPPKPTPRPTPKKTATPSQPTVKKQTAPQNNVLATLAQELEKNIATMQTSTAQKKRAMAMQNTTRLQIDIPEENESSYVSSLTHFLHTTLHLPDFGAVKIQLTVRRDGTIAKLLVLKTESEENRNYLEKQIPILRFPPLQGEYAKEDTHIFVLTFCNEL